MNRPAPPPLLIQMPLCPVCAEDVHPVADGGFECDRCLCSWPLEVDGFTEGEWLDADAERCAVKCQPWADNRWVSEVRQRQVFQCVLDARHLEHEGDLRLHAHPEVTGAVFEKGWRG